MPRCLLAVYAGLLLLLAAASAVGGLLLFRDLSSGDPIDAVANRHAYDVMGWELRPFPQRGLSKLATGFAGLRRRRERGGRGRPPATLLRPGVRDRPAGKAGRRQRPPRRGAARAGRDRERRGGDDRDPHRRLPARAGGGDEPAPLLGHRHALPTGPLRARPPPAGARAPPPQSSVRRRRHGSPRSSSIPAASPPIPASSLSWRRSARWWRPP